MAVTNSPKKPTHNQLAALASLVPSATFKPTSGFYWSPQRQVIAYDVAALDSKEGLWSLLHETAHAQLNHQSYQTDFELLQIEVAAWEQAKQLAKTLSTSISEDYVQDCLDTYRDWLHQRSRCPVCGTIGLQQSTTDYHCHNCHAMWHVTSSRFCRPYRRKVTSLKEKSPDSAKNQTTFR